MFSSNVGRVRQRGLPCGVVEHASVDGRQERGPHDGQVPKELDRAPLRWRRAVIQLRAINLARQNGEESGTSFWSDETSSSRVSTMCSSSAPDILALKTISSA